MITNLLLFLIVAALFSISNTLNKICDNLKK